MLYLIQLHYQLDDEPQVHIPAQHFESTKGRLLADYIHTQFGPLYPFSQKAETGGYHHFTDEATGYWRTGGPDAAPDNPNATAFAHKAPLSATRPHLTDYLRYATGDEAATITFIPLSRP